METLTASIGELFARLSGRLIGSAALFIAGRFLIRFLLNYLRRSRLFHSLDGSVRTFLFSFARIGLYALLAISIISLLGVPMASIITVLASAGVAVGLALQGALTNLAGGIILIIFKPFKLGDFVEASGIKGTVKEVSLLYTVLVTADNRRVFVPNGTMMNASITNYSSEESLRIAIEVSCSREEDPERVCTLLRSVSAQDEAVLELPAPTAQITGSTDTALTFTLYAWVANGNYWPALYRLNQAIAKSLRDAHITLPATHIQQAP